jgi:hypothetical protein
MCADSEASQSREPGGVAENAQEPRSVTRKEVAFADGPLKGSKQILDEDFLVDGAEGWYPPPRKPDDPTAKGARYVLRKDEDGGWSFKEAGGIRLINREDVTIGLGVMQSVYAIALVIGFTRALEPSYPAIVHPVSEPSGQLGHPVLLLALSTLMLLGVRFFWVTRSLYALVILERAETKTKMEKRIATIMRYHFPITLAHALLFFVLCDTYAAMLHASTSTAPPRVDRFVSLTVALLVLNGVWLLTTFLGQTPLEGTTKWELPAVKWGIYNLSFSVIAVGWRLGYHALDASTSTVLLVASLIFLTNSFWDLGKTAEFYIIFPGDPLPR